MAKRDDEFKRLQAYHENTRIAIRYLDPPMARLIKGIKLAMGKMPAQKEILQLGLDELEERRRRVRIQRMDLASLPEGEGKAAAAPSAPGGAPAYQRIPAEQGIEIISPTEGAAKEGVLQGALQRWHARIKPADGDLIPKERVRWSSDKEGVLKGIEETRLDDGRATHAFIQFKFKIPREHVVTVEAIDSQGNRYTAQLPVKVIPALPEGTRLTGEVPEEELLFHAGDYPSAEFVQPSDIEWQKGLPMHKIITFIAELRSSDGKPFKARKVRFTSDKDGNLGVPLVRFEKGVTIAHAIFLFPTAGERTISITAIDEAGKTATRSSVLKILPRTLTEAPGGFTGELAEGEVPSTIEKFIKQKLRPAIDDLHGIYNNAVRHADRDMRFLVKWKRYVEKGFADVKDAVSDIRRDARDGQLDQVKKYTRRLTHGFRAFERRIALFNRAMREQRMLNHFLAQTRDGIINIHNLTRQFAFRPEDMALWELTGKKEYTADANNPFVEANVTIDKSYVTIQTRVQEMGRRVQRIDEDIKKYKKTLDDMIEILESAMGTSTATAKACATLTLDKLSAAQEELLSDIDGMIELLRGLISDIVVSQKQLDRIEAVSKEFKR